jgi:hypothetical protein
MGAKASERSRIQMKEPTRTPKLRVPSHILRMRFWGQVLGTPTTSDAVAQVTRLLSGGFQFVILDTHLVDECYFVRLQLNVFGVYPNTLFVFLVLQPYLYAGGLVELTTTLLQFYT